MKSKSPTQSDDLVVVSIRGLTKRFGSFLAVDNLELEVLRGEVFGLLGPNGSGKTTTVRLLTGFLEPDEGEIIINGRNSVDHLVTLKKQMGILPDASALFRRITIWEHLLLAATVHRLPRREAESRAEDLLRFVDLWDRRWMHADTASNGMKKKLLFCMALIHKPEMLILDEPFEGLDPVSVRNIRILIRRLADQGTTVFVTSHLLHEMSALIDRFGLFYQGRVQQLRTMTEIRAQGQHLDDIYFAFQEKLETKEVGLAWLWS